jgi:hypothetical protein
MRAEKSKMFTAMMLIVISALLASPTFAQSTADTADGRFHDDLLDHLVGKWDVTSIAHGDSSTAVIMAEWVLNHQFLHYRFIGNETIPRIGTPMEIECFIGYNHVNKRYVVLGMSIFGVDFFEGFSYGSRNGNEIKVLQKPNNEADDTNIQTYIWEPTTDSWTIQSRPEVGGKEGEVFLDMQLVRQTH